MLVRAADGKGLILRMIGGVAVRQALHQYRAAYDRLRAVPRDIDLLAPRKTSSQIKDLFVSLGYVPDERLIAWRGNKRHLYYHLHSNNGPIRQVDVFLGNPPMCHQMEFEGRLNLSGPAMTPSDLLLQKLQIVEINQKDLIDTAFLLLKYAPSEKDKTDAISIPRLTVVLRHDRGFYYTAVQNLRRLSTAPEFLGLELGVGVPDRARGLIDEIEATPKTVRWKMRAKIGTKVRWFQEVEEVVR